jgi:hypothetical protein
MIDLDPVFVLAHLLATTRQGPIPGFELRDVKSGALDLRVTGRPQAATCLFCRKTIASWKGRPAGKRTTRMRALPKSLDAAMREHTPACSEAWLWGVLSRWSTGFATPFERRSIETWRARFVRVETMFARLPHPPGSDIAQELEVALIAISRLWDP